jgi:hypothetical protein
LRGVDWNKFTDVSEVLPTSNIIALCDEGNKHQITRRNIPEDGRLQVWPRSVGSPAKLVSLH